MQTTCICGTACSLSLSHCGFWFATCSSQGMNLAKDIRDRERGGRAQVGVVDGENEADSPVLMKVLVYVLGEKGEIQPAIPDAVVDQKLKSALKLYR